MKTFNALVIAHYDFTNKEGRAIKTTKFLISLGEFGTIVACHEKGNELDLLSETFVTLKYDDRRKSLVIDDVV